MSEGGPMAVVVRGGEVYAPAPLGRRDVLLLAGCIAKIGPVDPGAVEALGVPVEVIDARDGYVVPGLVDGHEHIDGGSGESGFGSRTPALTADGILAGGITTVVGCLGADTTTKTMPALLAHARALAAGGVDARIYTGGYCLPPATLTGSVRTDILYVPEVVGVGEVAIADTRGSQPDPATLARLVCDAHTAGRLAGKAGVTHLHVGEAREGLTLVRALLDDYPVPPGAIHPTHVGRSERLMAQAVDLTRRGVTVDVDVVERDLVRWLRYGLAHGLDFGRLTVSSDAAGESPEGLWEQVREAARKKILTLDQALDLVTRNPARVLGLRGKGRLALGNDGDILVTTRDLDIVHVRARGRAVKPAIETRNAAK